MNSMEVLYMTFGSSLTFVKFGRFSTSHTFNSSDSRVSFFYNRTAILLALDVFLANFLFGHSQIHKYYFSHFPVAVEFAMK